VRLGILKKEIKNNNNPSVITKMMMANQGIEALKKVKDATFSTPKINAPMPIDW
jgi:hypothetical protein